MTSDTIGVTVTFKEPVTFYLRMIGVAEETEIRQKMFGLTEKEAEDQSYQNNVNLLAELSVKMPEGLFPLKPVNVSDADDTVYLSDFKAPKDAVEAYFGVKTVLRERLAEYAVRAYFIRLQPTVDFL